MTAASSSLSVSETMNSNFSLLCFHRTCFTGRASVFTASLCSITSLGTPGKPDASQAKTSEFSRRKSTSTLSYLLVRWAPMVMAREPSLMSATFLVIRGSSRNGALLEAAGAEPPGSLRPRKERQHQRPARLAGCPPLRPPSGSASECSRWHHWCRP